MRTRLAGMLLLLLVFLLVAAVPGARAACTITVSSISVTYLPASTSAVTATGLITVTCTALSGLGTYQLILGPGGGGTYLGRRMVGPSGNLPYQLYSDSGMTSIWGDGSGGSSAVAGIDTRPLLGGTTTFPFYLKIPAGVPLNPGTYTDASVVGTLNY